LAYLFSSFKHGIFVDSDKAAAVLLYLVAPFLLLLLAPFLFGLFGFQDDILN
jgi:hypothetical protein